MKVGQARDLHPNLATYASHTSRWVASHVDTSVWKFGFRGED